VDICFLTGCPELNKYPGTHTDHSGYLLTKYP
jgi:hypothetical protein